MACATTQAPPCPHTIKATTLAPEPIPALPANYAKDPQKVSFAGRQFPVSPVLHTFFWFVAERHQIHQRRLAGEPQPWTNDEILRAHTFTNVFRVYDRVTQYIFRNVIKKGDQSLEESCFRVILFRLFNRIETWELLERNLGTPTLTWHDFDVAEYEEVLTGHDGALYGAGYIIPAPKLGCERNSSNHLRLIKLLMEQGLPRKLKSLKYLKDAHGITCLFPSMGDFTAMQLLLDLNMLPHFDFSEDEWVALGPGSTACIRKMFGPSVRGYENEAICWLYDSQMSHFARLGIRGPQIPRLCAARPAGMSMVDIEHALCECEKFSRAKFPEIKGKRTVVGKAFRTSWRPITADLPDKWHRPPANIRPLPRPPAVGESDNIPLYEVSHIVMEKKSSSSSGRRFLVRWTGWGPEDDTWMSVADLAEGAREMLAEWEAVKSRIEQQIEDIKASK